MVSACSFSSLACWSATAFPTTGGTCDSYNSTSKILSCYSTIVFFILWKLGQFWLFCQCHVMLEAQRSRPSNVNISLIKVLQHNQDKLSTSTHPVLYHFFFYLPLHVLVSGCFVIADLRHERKCLVIPPTINVKTVYNK